MTFTGSLFSLIGQQAQRGLPPLSFLQDRFSDILTWRAEVADILRDLLLYRPDVVDLSPELADYTDYPDYIQQKWYITAAPGERVPVMLLLPRLLDGPAPALLALHCDNGMYFFGKKKLIDDESDPKILVQHRQQYYGGTAIAGELARRGYVVAVSDSFYFGERRPTIPAPPELAPEFLLVAEGSDHWIELVNRVSAIAESAVAKSLMLAGITWPGINVWDDMRVVDFLLTRPEVDPGRIGCLGFSLGGHRAGLLGALDPRVRACCIVGWMTTLADLLEAAADQQSWATFIPGLTCLLDWPDVVGLHAPDPLLVMQGSQDLRFPLSGYQKAAERLRGIYAKAGAPGSLDIGLYDLPHLFSPEMQRLAWAFFDTALTAPRPLALEV